VALDSALAAAELAALGARPANVDRCADLSGGRARSHSMGMAWGSGLHFLMPSVALLAESLLRRLAESLEFPLMLLVLKALPNLRLEPALC